MPAFVAGIHDFLIEKTWMAGTSPAMTTEGLNAPHFPICVCSVFSTARSNESAARAGAFLR
jgi:hypothetical protein